MQEQLASMRTEKEILEGVLFDTQTNLEATHIKKTQLEKEQKEILIKQESFKGQVTRLTKELENSEKRAQDIKQSLTQQSGDQIAEFQQIISNMKRQSEDSLKKINDEKVFTQLFMEFELSLTVQSIVLFLQCHIYFHCFIHFSPLSLGASKSKFRETVTTVSVTSRRREK